MNTEDEFPLRGLRLGFFGKGGCGKSTVVVLLARAFRHRGYEVAVLDADSTNIGIHRALGLEIEPASLIDFYGGLVFSGGAVTCPVDDPTPLPNSHLKLEDLPAEFRGRTEDGIDLLVCGKMGGRGPGAGCDGPIAKIARDLVIERNSSPHVTLLDFKAGLEDSVRGVVANIDWAFTVVDPTTAAIQMAAHLTQIVEMMIAGESPATEHLGSDTLVEIALQIYREARIRGVSAILNRVQNGEIEDYVLRELMLREVRIAGTIYEYADIADAWLKGLPVDLREAAEDAGNVLRAFEGDFRMPV